MKKEFYVYILASHRNGTLYVGVTSNLTRRVWQHRNEVVDGFSETYHVHKLVYYEPHMTAASAIHREKRLKQWNRQWKRALIESSNPGWEDLWSRIIQNI